MEREKDRERETVKKRKVEETQRERQRERDKRERGKEKEREIDEIYFDYTSASITKIHMLFQKSLSKIWIALEKVISWDASLTFVTTFMSALFKSFIYFYLLQYECTFIHVHILPINSFG